MNAAHRKETEYRKWCWCKLVKRRGGRAKSSTEHAFVDTVLGGPDMFKESYIDG